ncbi:DUF6325 family protein [Streptomyces sp. NPDC060035]|uniref:SHOCT domain-containing protein n=1 Tax=Streptomyces sp. NPDC060035 TaxID=3347044 RepID=UPI0036A9D0B8
MAVGPVEYLVVVFPGSSLTGPMASALADAVASEAVRVLDLAFVHRGEGGTLAFKELRDVDLDGLVSFEPAAGEVAGLSAVKNIDALGRNVPPGSSAALIVREDLWAVPLTRAVQAAGGQLVAHERLGAEGDAEVAGEPTGGGDDVITLLERLAELRKQNVLSDAEFAAQKTRILAD